MSSHPPSSSRSGAKKLLVGSLIVALSIGAAIAIGLIVTGSEFDETSGKAIGTAALLALYSLAALGCAALLGVRPELAWIAVSGLIFTALALITGWTAIWIETNGDGLWQAAGSLGISAVGIAQVSLLLSTRRPGAGALYGGVRLASTAVTIALAFMLAMQIAVGDSEVISWRLIGVVAVLYVLGNVLLPLTRVLEARR